MNDQLLGLHHITAIASDAKRTLDFYTRVLGLRLVKKTVNFDDPKTYHFYFGDESGTPGSILTFFPWQGLGKGRAGTGMATDIGYSVPTDSLDFWEERLSNLQVPHEKIARAFGEEFIALEDPDGLRLRLIGVRDDQRKGWTVEGIPASAAIRGFHSVTLTLQHAEATAAILTEVFDYRLTKTEGTVTRYEASAVNTASIVDIVELPDGKAGINAAGTNHHVAFRVANEEVLMAYREKIEARGLRITPKIDRDYFFSLYFREPGGVLFEIATDNPGFTRDEDLSELGTHLRLPKQHEAARASIESVLPKLD